jgi:hypothetical protein
MGFMLGASFFFGMCGRNVTEGTPTAQHEQQAPNEAAKSKKDETDEAIAFYTLWLMAFTGILAFATIGLGGATVLLYATGEKQFKFSMRSAIRQAKATKESIAAAREANNVAERALIAGQRPWLHVDVFIDGDMTFDDHGNALLPLVFILKNIGRSPATNVRVNPFIFLDSPRHPRPIVEYKKFCDIIRGTHDHLMSHTLFPEEQPREISMYTSISSAQFEEHRESWAAHASEWKYFSPHVIGCVSYSIPFDDHQHQTGFMAQLKRRLRVEPTGLEWGMFNLDERVVTSTDMKLFHSPSGSPHID